MPSLTVINPIYREFRAGDVKHSEASIQKISKELNYLPTHKVLDGIKKTIDWYVRRRNI